YIPSRPPEGTVPLYGDLRNEVVLEETTHDTGGAVEDASVESTTRLYVSRPMEAKGKLFVELAAGRAEQGVLTKYPLPTKFNQFVDMKMRFRYGTPQQEKQSRAMELRTIDEAGGIISDYFTYDRLWLQSWDEEVTERSCRVIPRFDTWPSDRRELWRRGLTMLGKFLEDADGIILLLSPALSSLRDQAQQVNLARGVFRFVTEYELPLVIAVSKADRLGEFREEIDRVVRDRSYRSALDIPDFLLRRDGSGMGTILVANDGKQISAKEDVFLMSSAVAAPDGPPLLVGESGAESPASEDGGQGVPVMVNTTLPLARICEKVLARRGPAKG
ncbi:MAG: hypothetical protein L3J93_03705, partial [Thermoplasmata archaeon]|nr:hypothetical protein [Thermoplasmata archaeon]